MVLICGQFKVMIVVTGASGFIASCLVTRLNADRFVDLILVDDFKSLSKHPNHERTGKNFQGKQYKQLVDRTEFPEWLRENENQVDFVFHIGARTDTTEFDYEIFRELNLDYSKQIWNICAEYAIPLVYASSAATYGNGEFGYRDDHDLCSQLKPLNPYGESKNDFDIWALQQKEAPFFWAGLKFFNVYGPNEYHKERMASVIFHAYRQISQNGKMKLFRSHRADYTDGGQMRDFIYVKDACSGIVSLLHGLLKDRLESGAYNICTGRETTVKEFCQTAARLMDADRTLLNLGALPLRPDEYKMVVGDPHLIQRKTEWKPEFSVENGIIEVLKYYNLDPKG